LAAQKKRFICCALLLVLMVSAGTALGYEEIIVFLPGTSPEHDGTTRNYWYWSDWTKEFGYAPAEAGVNPNSGYTGVYASGWIGSSAAEAWQGIEFDLLYPSAIKAEVTIAYAGDTINFGPGSFSGTAWLWKLDNEKTNRNYIDHPFSWNVILMKVLDIVLGLAGVGAAGSAAQAIDVASGIISAFDLGTAIYDAINAGDGAELKKTFYFTADPGKHKLWVGLRGEASGLITGSGFAIMFGQIPKIKLMINNGFASPADIIVRSMSVSNWELRRDNEITFDLAFSNIGGAPAIGLGYKFEVLEPNAPDYITLSDNWEGETNVDPRHTDNRYPTYTFATKGNYTFRATVRTLEEPDETNNVMTKEFYVKGLPPGKPTKPTIPADHILYRNNTYTFGTSAIDPDDDPLMYTFNLRRADEDEWFKPIWDPNTLGWVNPNTVSYTPYSITTDIAGTYYITAQVIDNDGFLSEWSNQNFFEIIENMTPSNPTITGPSTGYTTATHSFIFSSTDIENDRIAYRIDWGDGSTITDYYWPTERGGDITLTHQFDTPGTYYVQAQTQDSLGAQSGWTTHEVSITEYTIPASTIVVKTNTPSATFSITGTEDFDGHGTFWTTSADPGSYTITFNDVAHHDTPDGATQNLAVDESITFEGEYVHHTGTIQVSTNHASASYTVRGTGFTKAEKYSGDGTSGGPWIDAYAGNYIITYDPVDGYCLPSTRGEMKTLNQDQTITFSGRYVQPPVAALTITSPNDIIIEGEDVVDFDGSASYSPEPDFDIAKYSFYFGDGGMYVEGPAEDPNDAPDGAFDGKASHVYLARGYYSASLVVSDPCDNSNVEYVNLLVHVKSRPLAYLSVDPSPAIVGESVDFDGRGVDYDGDDIVAYEWQSNLDGFLSDQEDFSTDRLTPGVHSISLRVQDSDELWSEWIEEFLVVFEALDWPMFKTNDPRVSSQGSYWGRLYGMIPYNQVWSHATNGPITGSPAAANLDGDWTNGLEIAFASSGGNLYVTDNGGNLLWSKNIGASNSNPAIEDIDNDGRLDIVVGSSQGVYAYDPIGNSIYTFPAVPGPAFDSAPVIANIDADPNSNMETIIGSNDGNVYAIDNNGNQLWAFAPPGPPAAFTSSPAVAEIEPNRPGLEIVIGGTDGVLYVLDPNGTKITSFSVPGLNPIHTTPAIGELVPTAPGPEIVFGCDDGKLYCLNYRNFALNPCWQYATALLMPIRSSPAIGFVAEYGGTGAQVAFGCDDGTVYVLKTLNATLVGSFSLPAPTMFRSTPAITNIDTTMVHPSLGDLPEVIIGATNGRLYALNFTGGVLGVDLFAGMPPLAPGNSIVSSPAVADINHDPDKEILIGAGDTNIYMVEAVKNPASSPNADFNANTTGGNPPVDVSFSDQSTNSPLIWSWDFGDNTTSTEQNPNHTYITPGTYTVSLTAANAHGDDSVTKNDYITVNPVPVADLTHSPTSGTVPFIVEFSDQSQYDPVFWSWDFGDEGTSMDQDPNHTYTTPGLYTVSLTVTNAHGSDNITKSDCILALPPLPTADFTQDVTSGEEPLLVNFTDTSTGSPTSWRWNFGDGSISLQQNPPHTYQNPGNYLVSLTVSNTAGSDTKTNTAYIRVGDYLADLNHDGKVDLKDYAIFGAAYQTQVGQPDYSELADLYESDTINVMDLAVFIDEWMGGCGPQPTVIFSDDFDDGVMDGWTVIPTGGGSFVASSDEYNSPPYSAYMDSMGTSKAMAVSPSFDPNLSEDYNVSFAFMLPDINNHWFEVFNNHQVYLLIDGETDLKSYSPTNPIMTLATDRWYQIEIKVHPSSSNYEVYIDDEFKETIPFWIHGGLETTFQIGDREATSQDYGQAYWDDLIITQTLSP